MIKDKLTKSIAEAAKAVMVETWPDSAMTSLYVDKPGKTPISDAETAASHTMTDEEITEAEISEALKASQPASEWIHDFVNSKDKKFAGKSKAERINMALGAYYAAQKNVKEATAGSQAELDGIERWVRDSGNATGEHADDWDWDSEKKVLTVHNEDGTTSTFTGKEIAQSSPNDPRLKHLGEGVEEPRAEGEKRFKAAHVINKVRDVNQDKQTGTESMPEDSKPLRPIGTTPTAPEHYDELEQVEQDFKEIKGSVSKQAKAPEAKGTKQAGAESAESLKDTTKGGSQNAVAPKATGSKQSGAESADKLKDTAPSGKQDAQAPKAGQKSPQAMPQGLKGPSLKESALAALLGEDAVDASKHVKKAQVTKPTEDKIKKVLSKGTPEYTETVKEDLDEGIFDTIKALGKNVATKVADKVSSGVQAVAAELQKAKAQGDQAEITRLQARLKQLGAAAPAADETPAPAAANAPTSDYGTPEHLKRLEAKLKAATPEHRKEQLDFWIPALKTGKFPKSGKALDSEQKIVGAHIVKTINTLNKKAPAAKAAPAPAAPKAPVGAAAAAQAKAQGKVGKTSTKQLQANLARIKAELQSRGIKTEGFEAFDLIEAVILAECEMSDFDKRFAKDNEKALKQILSGQGTDGIDSRLQPQLQKFITSYGDELKKYLGIQVEEDSKGWDGTAEVNAKHEGHTDGLVKEDTVVEGKLQEAANPIEDLRWDELNSYVVKHYPNELVVTTSADPEKFEEILKVQLKYQEDTIESALRDKGFSAVTGVLSKKTFDSVKEASEDADTSVPNNAIIAALKDLTEVIDRCEGNCPNRPDFKNTHLLMKIQKAQRLLADVCEELEAIED